MPKEFAVNGEIVNEPTHTHISFAINKENTKKRNKIDEVEEECVENRELAAFLQYVKITFDGQ